MAADDKLPSYGNRIHNHFPDCVHVDLGWGSARASTVSLLVAINFNEHTQRLLAGTVRWGIRGGELRLSLKNARAPYADRAFVQELSPKINSIRRSGQTSKKGAESKGKLSFQLRISKGGPEGKLTGKTSDGSSKADEWFIQDEFKNTLFQITTKGSEEEPVWSFFSQSGGGMLLGAVKKRSLAKLHLSGENCHVSARFEADRYQVVITQVEGAFPESLKTETRGIIRAVILRWIRGRAGRIMSKGELSYDRQEGFKGSSQRNPAFGRGRRRKYNRVNKVG